MGWKTLKEHYRIGHYVQVTEEGICIGSPYIHNLIVIGLDGAIIKEDDGRVNEDLRRYMAEMRADPAKLREVVLAKDTFTASIPVYTYDGANIIQKQCEKLDWPNVTHDGCMMYENSFSTDMTRVVRWAKKNAAAGVKWREERITELQRNIAEIEADREKCHADLIKLEKDYPV